MTWLSDRERVVVPLDDSEPSYRALSLAVELFGPARIRAIHVYTHAPLTFFDYAPPEGFTEAAHIARGRAAIEARMAARGAGGASLEVRPGRPATVICEYIAEIDADLVIIPSHGRSGLRRLVMGSVAEEVIRHAGCPTLVLRRDGGHG